MDFHSALYNVGWLVVFKVYYVPCYLASNLFVFSWIDDIFKMKMRNEEMCLDKYHLNGRCVWLYFIVFEIKTSNPETEL
jgi:hypothetical protein